MGFFKRATKEEIEEAIANDDGNRDTNRLSDVTL
uniref:Uncharacterized protein n=1 Tax=Bracon brevicornis TaxID=1563983 RepID=A0A6V7L1K4_9HYME